MSEHVSYRLERIDGLRVEESMADKAIAQICDAYEETLANGKRVAYRENEDVGAKVTQACMDLADPEKLKQRNTAVNLRSWHIIRLLKRHLEELPPGQEWPYRLFPIGRDNWQKEWDREVVEATDANLRKFVSTTYSVDPRPQLIVENDDRTYKEELLLQHEGRALVRQQWAYPETGDPYQVYFTVKA